MARQNDHIRAEELISAYLDKRITAEEKNFFERHIASCANCRAQLEATRSMVAALKVMPAVKAPRSFVLPREMAKQPRRSFLPLYPALRLATVVAALAFVILFASDVLTNRSGGSLTTSSIPAAAPAVVEAPAQAPEAPRAAAPAPEATTTAMYEAAGSAAALSDTVVAPAAGASAKAALSNTGAITETTAMSMIGATPEVALQSQMPAETTPQPEATAMPAEAQATRADQPANAANVPAATSGIEPQRILEIVLLVLAVGFGIAALAARRRQA